MFCGDDRLKDAPRVAERPQQSRFCLELGLLVLLEARRRHAYGTCTKWRQGEAVQRGGACSAVPRVESCRVEVGAGTFKVPESLTWLCRRDEQMKRVGNRRKRPHIYPRGERGWMSKTGARQSRQEVREWPAQTGKGRGMRQFKIFSGIVLLGRYSQTTTIVPLTTGPNGGPSPRGVMGSMVIKA